MDRFHKLEGIKQMGSKIPPQPKKQTAANNKFLAEVKETFNKAIYKKIYGIVNDQGNAAGQAALNEIKKYI
jgi:hypothetical protein